MPGTGGWGRHWEGVIGHWEVGQGREVSEWSGARIRHMGQILIPGPGPQPQSGLLGLAEELHLDHCHIIQGKGN